ncbi:hypothetical protein L596_027146 [Steinernema carpocapsae]|uniref:Uncharacterized protein n=1 Tax=Steinernema carpocapsae TaxID=34508 RepID=A0A4U5M3G7_STECR|nr:hypothetical protein L596_027146 [Steinernema carpocapsae]
MRLTHWTLCCHKADKLWNALEYSQGNLSKCQSQIKLLTCFEITLGEVPLSVHQPSLAFLGNRSLIENEL